MLYNCSVMQSEQDDKMVSSLERLVIYKFINLLLNTTLEQSSHGITNRLTDQGFTHHHRHLYK